MSMYKVLSPTASSLFIVLIASLLFFLASIDATGDRFCFSALTALLMVYLILEIGRIRHRHPDRWLMNPVVLCSIMTFLMGYGITNVIFFLSEKQLELLNMVPEVTAPMVKIMFLVLLGAAAMWLGYWSPIANFLSTPRAVQGFQARLLPQTRLLRSFAIPSLMIIASLSRLLQINLGVFGYSSSYERMIEMGAVTQYLSLASGLGKLALVVAAFRYYSNDCRKSDKRWLYVVLSIELAFGFLSGFKSTIGMPFIILACCQYLHTGKISKHWIVLGIVGIFIAYAVIEPFRAARNEDDQFNGTSIVSIARTMFNAPSDSAKAVTESAPIVISIASRFNLSYIGSFAIDFADKNSPLPEGSPNFLSDIFLAPLHALIPRFIWNDKPLGNLGLWYTQEVLGMSYFSSTAMGPFSYLYFAGGFVAVFLGFFFIGVLQRSIFFLLQPQQSAAGGVVFLAFLSTLVLIDSSFNAIIITFCRELPIILLIQFALFSARKSNTSALR